MTIDEKLVEVAGDKKQQWYQRQSTSNAGMHNKITTKMAKCIPTRTYNMIYNINNRPSMWPNNDLTVCLHVFFLYAWYWLLFFDSHPFEIFTVIIIIFNLCWTTNSEFSELAILHFAKTTTQRREKKTYWIIHTLAVFDCEYAITFSSSQHFCCEIWAIGFEYSICKLRTIAPFVHMEID